MVWSHSILKQGIGKVEMFKRFGYNGRTLGLEARVGNTETPVSHGRRHINVNTKCGSKSSVATNQDSAVFLCNPRLTGKYLTLQGMAHSQLNIGEINVFQYRE